MLASAIGHQVQPFLDRLTQEVERQQRFRISNVGIVEDGEKVGVIGIRCEVEPTLRLPALSFGLFVTRLDDTAPGKVVASVAWSAPWIRNQQDGFAAYEGRFGPVALEDSLLHESVLRRLTVFEKRFCYALHRGRPPGKFLALWRALTEGVPMPKIIRITDSETQTPNQALLPTTTAVTPPAGQEPRQP
jgi:hypothetical protein